MHTDHVDISQAFTQGELLDGDEQIGNAYISTGYASDNEYYYLLKRPLYGMPSAARAWFTTVSEFLKTEACTKFGYVECMCQEQQNGHTIILKAHIDDFVIAYADRTTLDKFVNTARPGLTLPYSELSKYAQCPQPSHIAEAEHVLRYLRGTYQLDINYHRDALHPDKFWSGLTRIGRFM
jgi:hypothetical protein